jgi:DNA-binding CsgD family transcriptional regulator
MFYYTFGMSVPRRKKSSRKDPKQNNLYQHILGDPLRLVQHRDPAVQENRSPNDPDPNVPAGGRRATDRYLGGLYVHWDSLSSREQDVTILVCKGDTDAEIASRLGLSISTIRSYLRHIFFKTRVGNRRHLILKFAQFRFPRDIPPRI